MVDFPKRAKTRKVEHSMTPMIDVVFQLLVFFLFTFKIVPVEGEIGVNMPPITVGSAANKEDSDVERIIVYLAAGGGGVLEDVVFGENSLGSGEAGLRALSDLLKETFGGLGGPVDDVEIEIDAERTLKYHWVIRATNAIMYAGIANINFTDPKLEP